MSADVYPTALAERDAWITSRRGRRNVVSAERPYAFFVEDERADSGECVSVATVFLTNRECPWRCLMCDLWQNTLTETVPVGAIPAQIDYAFQQFGADKLRSARHVKLYNSGSFFDVRAIPAEDYPAIAQRVVSFERVIVECHPSLIGKRVLAFQNELRIAAGENGHVPKLEIAMGLETAHPEILERLNKRTTIDDFARAAAFLREQDIALRVFILVKPPFMDEAEALEWAKRSVDFAFANHASVIALIPTRGGNGALETLTQLGEFTPPRLETLEAAMDHGVGLQRGRVFADLWDLEKFSRCPHCFAARRERLNTMNFTQQLLPRIACPQCAGA